MGVEQDLLRGAVIAGSDGGKRGQRGRRSDERRAGGRARTVLWTTYTLSQERRWQSVTDELTGLGHRRYLNVVLDSFFTDCDGRPRLAVSTGTAG
jgi:GGDEF domain-containing protein